MNMNPGKGISESQTLVGMYTQRIRSVDKRNSFDPAGRVHRVVQSALKSPFCAIKLEYPVVLQAARRSARCILNMRQSKSFLNDGI